MIVSPSAGPDTPTSPINIAPRVGQCNVQRQRRWDMARPKRPRDLCIRRQYKHLERDARKEPAGAVGACRSLRPKGMAAQDRTKASAIFFGGSLGAAASAVAWVGCVATLGDGGRFSSKNGRTSINCPLPAGLYTDMSRWVMPVLAQREPTTSNVDGLHSAIIRARLRSVCEKFSRNALR